ncbi:MAG: cyclase family protein, partial [bacterium]
FVPRESSVTIETMAEPVVVPGDARFLLGEFPQDISITLGKDVVNYPETPVYSLKRVVAFNQEKPYALSRLQMSTHSGTHLDFPYHFLPSGKRLEDYSMERFFLPALVLHLPGVPEIRAESLANEDIRPGDAILFRTDNSDRGILHGPCFRSDFVDLSLEAARVLAEKGILLVGIDALSLERAEDPSFPVHRLVLSRDILILEGIDLANVAAGRYTLAAFPLKLKDSEASPVRAVLLAETHSTGR